MRRFIILLALMGVMLAVSPSTAMAGQHEDGVSATVTPAFIAISTTSQFTGYGTVDLDTTGNLPIGQTGSTSTGAAFLVENTGTKTADWAIVGGASVDWSIGADAGADTYKHSWDDAATSGVPTSPTSLHSSQPLATGVTATTVLPVWLTLDMPISGLFTAEQTLPITITATTAA